MSAIYVKLSTAPELARVVSCGTPDSRPREVRVCTLADPFSVRVYGDFWDGGSKRAYSFVDLATGRFISAPRRNPLLNGAPYDVPLPPGVACVVEVCCRGKYLAPELYVRPDNLNPLMLPAPAGLEPGSDAHVVLEGGARARSTRCAAA